MRIRPYEPGDATDLARIYRDAVLHAGAQAYTSVQARAWAAVADDVEGFRDQLGRGLTLVATTASGEPAAFGQLEPEDTIALLYTAPGYARASYATGIYRLLEEHARTAGAHVLHVATSRVAQPFFEKQGFELIAAEEVTRGGVAIERLRMARRLDEPAGPGA